MKTEWKGRSAFHLGNDRVEMTMLTGGGHIASFSFTPSSGHPTENAIWESPWPSADPLTPKHDELSAQYGGRPTGTFLASYTGHSLSLDCFGPPSDLEASLGITLHGEAGVANWICESDGARGGLIMRAELPIVGLQARRKIQIAAGESVARVEEQVRNLRDTAREIQWQQHATLGAPLVNAKSSSIAASVGKGQRGRWDTMGLVSSRRTGHSIGRTSTRRPMEGATCGARSRLRTAAILSL
ncbi:MAG: aldose epimerase family protein [Acidobacteriaceae bacterium]